jgi:hypothetical protein
MKKFGLFLACLALVAGYAIPVAAATSQLIVTLAAQNGSGETGTAVLTQVGGDVKVVVSIPNGPAGPQPAHIHTGTCASLGGVAYPLQSLANGSSSTTVKGVTIDQLVAAKDAINVHKSADDLGVYVSCGNIMPTMSSM